ncbi:hypothetical protein ACIQVT_00890 [Streptomyces sp. NPDC100445]|uniref:hypothetical protein n=1 Tax=Streptomyces sp. NPDC100445 TaxID=3366102 RepID=UPI00382A7D64
MTDRGGRAAGAVFLVHVVTAPRTSWRVVRGPATEPRVPAPVRDLGWVASHSPGEYEWTEG